MSDAFAHRNVHVTTRHSYEISYKYVWTCAGCGYEFKRHSRSIDTGRHSCGKCRGKLVQTRPKPRGGGGGGGTGPKGDDGKVREKTEYQVFVKEHFGRVKREMGERGLETGMGRVMAELAREYRERKGGREREAEKKVEDVDLIFKGLSLGD